MSGERKYMNIRIDRLPAKGARKCPQCTAKMIVTSVIPEVFGNGYDDITYKCKHCGTQIKLRSHLN